MWNIGAMPMPQADPEKLSTIADERLMATARETVATACRILGTLELTHEALGHVSFRPEGSESFLIKAKGPAEVGLRYATSQDVIRVDFGINCLDEVTGLQPPSETYIHSSIYAANSSVRSVVHIHPEYAVLLTICDVPVEPIFGAFALGSRLALDPVPIYPRSLTVADAKTGADFARFMDGRPVALMRGHGITVTGSSVEEATVRAIAFCQLAAMNYRARLLGQPQRLPADELEELRAPLPTRRPRGSAGGSDGVLATWRYYERLAGGLA
jgi:L-fuculose-phosphate aldolase